MLPSQNLCFPSSLNEEGGKGGGSVEPCSFVWFSSIWVWRRPVRSEPGGVPRVAWGLARGGCEPKANRRTNAEHIWSCESGMTADKPIELTVRRFVCPFVRAHARARECWKPSIGPLPAIRANGERPLFIWHFGTLSAGNFLAHGIRFISSKWRNLWWRQFVDFPFCNLLLYFFPILALPLSMNSMLVAFVSWYCRKNLISRARACVCVWVCACVYVREM